MADTISTPTLDATLGHLVRRERRRRMKAIAVRWSVALAATVALLAAWRVHDWIESKEPPSLAFSAVLVLVVALIGCLLLTTAKFPSEETTAREIDRRLGLDDRTATALAISRGGVTAGLAAHVVRDTEDVLLMSSEAIDAAFPRPVGGPTWRRAFLAWFVAFACLVAAFVVQVLTFHGPLPILPGFPQPGGGEQREGAPPSKGAPRREGDGPQKKPDAKKPPDEKAKPEKTDEKQPVPPGDVRVTVKLTKDEFDADEAVPATVTAVATGKLPGASTFDVRAALDDADADTGATVRVENGGTEPGSVPPSATFDVRKVPTLKLQPGEHTLRARLTTRDSLEEHWSEPVTFRVRPPKDDKKDDKDKKGEQPKPKQEPQPPKDPPPPEPKKSEPKKGPGPPPMPPVALDRHVVVPLFREGDEVAKKGPILVLEPGGGTGAPAEKKPLEEALPQARRQAEQSVDNARVPAEDKALVRRYFDLLEALRK